MIETLDIVDFPKIKSPFVRETINGHYVVTPKIEPGYEWVFEDSGVKAVDKLHGTNICLHIEDGRVCSIDNRSTRLVHCPIIDLTIKGQAARAIEGILLNQEHIKNMSGRVYGELIGPKINGNIHCLDHHKFVPFEYLNNKCHWKSWVRGQYPKTFDAISDWFKTLESLYTYRATRKRELAEGLIFLHPDGRRAKLRREMFDWYYS